MTGSEPHASLPVHVLRKGERWQDAARNDTCVFLLATDGIFLLEQTPFVTWARPVEFSDLTRLLADHGRADIGHGTGALATRIPYGLLSAAVAFFRTVWRVQYREDILLLYYFYAQKQYTLVHPQLRSADERHVEYLLPETPRDAVRLGSFHSHGRKRAYHSVVDREDDAQSPGLHVILGHLDQVPVSLQCYWVEGAGTVPLQPSEVFDIPQPSAFPKEWELTEPPRTRSVRKQSSPFG